MPRRCSHQRCWRRRKLLGSCTCAATASDRRLTLSAPEAKPSLNKTMRGRRKYRSMETPEPGLDQGVNAPPSPPLPQRPLLSQPELVSIALDTGQIEVWSWDIASNRVVWLSHAEGTPGFSDGRSEGALSDFENDIHPD